MERKVYVGWAYSKNQDEKQQINREIYGDLIKNVFWLGNETPKKELEELKKTKVIMKYCGQGWSNHYVRVMSNPYNLSKDELALIADDGNLCFGYHVNGNDFVIYKD